MKNKYRFWGKMVIFLSNASPHQPRDLFERYFLPMNTSERLYVPVSGGGGGGANTPAHIYYIYLVPSASSTIT